MRRAALIAIAALAVTAAPAAAQSPDPAFDAPEPHLQQITPDGSHVTFITGEALAASDTDGGYRDVYIWSASDGQIRQVSSGGNGPYHARSRFVSDSGARVIFSTRERLEDGDSDDGEDLYAWSGSDVEQVTTGPDDPNAGSANVFFDAASRDGKRVLFTQLPPVIAGPGAPTFERYNGKTTRLATVSADPARPTEFFSVGDTTPDATRALGATAAPLVSADTDTTLDAYEVTTTSARQVSLGTNADRNPDHIVATHASTNLDHVLLETRQRLEPTDTDTYQDIYLRSGGRTHLISGPAPNLVDRLVSQAYDARAMDISDDGSTAVFTTAEKLSPADGDSEGDVYTWTAARGIELVSTGNGSGNDRFMSFDGVSPDGSRILFTSSGRVTADDTDDWPDIYERSGGVTRLLTRGSSDIVFLRGVSHDMRHVFFDAYESLLPEDGDTDTDAYEAFDGKLSLVSTGPADGHTTWSLGLRSSADGASYVWSTHERMTADDDDDAGASADERDDLYIRSGGVTRLVTPDP